MRYLIALLCVGFCAAEVMGDIVINVSEAVGGTHITASGSVVSQFNGTGGFPGLDFGDSLGGDPFISIPGDLGDFAILSGGGTINEETITGTAVYVGTFSIRSTGLISLDPGTVWSIDADFVTSLPFSYFIPGSYSGSNIGGIPVDGKVTMTITAVPEPSSMAFLAVAGTFGLLRFRRNKPAPCAVLSKS